MERCNEDERGSVDTTGHKKSGPDFDHCTEARVGPCEPKGDDETERCDDASGDSAEKEGIETGDAMQGDDWDAESSEGDWRGVCEQSEAGGFERGEAEANKKGSADSNGSAEACCTFKKCSEAEGYEHQLKTAVAGDAEKTTLQKLKTSRGGDELIHE